MLIDTVELQVRISLGSNTTRHTETIIHRGVTVQTLHLKYCMREASLRKLHHGDMTKKVQRGPGLMPIASKTTC